MTRPVLIVPTRILRPVLLALVASITCACSSQGNVADTPSEMTQAAPDPLLQADQALTRGDYGTAADIYATLATSRDDVAAAHLQAQAALALQETGDFAHADVLLAAAQPTAGSDPVFGLARARALLHAGHAPEALNLAGGLDGASLTPYQRGVRMRVLSGAAAATDNAALAASAGIAALQLPRPAEGDPALVQATWSALSKLPPGDITAQMKATAGDPAANGWYALAALSAQPSYDEVAFAQKLAEWQQAHPDHPAVALLAELHAKAPAATLAPRRIALILPFDDKLAVAGRAIRDGFLTAWYRDPSVQTRPAVNIYSNSGDDILKDYQRAVSEGAEFVIGPLQKNLVDRLKALPERSVGVLALNVADRSNTAAPAGFYQFGLTPEDEADQVARHAYGEGSRALIIAPNSAWGARLMAAYASTWKQLGGTVLAQVSYSESADAYAAAIRRALNIDMSEARATALRNRIGVPLHSEARHRSDADVILLAAFPDNARQLLPQLRYFGADGIPVFATSSVFTGTVDATRDIDMNGLVFGDMPWLFGAADGESLALIKRNWPGPAGSFGRLYGFGLDAYRVLPYLARMRARQTLRIPGVTGDLSMDPDGIIHRNMVWMKFVDGVPQATGSLAPAGVN